MNDRTIVKISHLPEGRDYAWHPDLNLVELSARLDEAGRRDALTCLQRSWLRGVLVELGELSAA